MGYKDSSPFVPSYQVQPFYLNVVGYKESTALKKALIDISFYLNVVGYKAKWGVPYRPSRPFYLNVV
ncbi:hypothetical protein, partial [Bacillus smithii]|uniref:hypothetical protein n=1 Tax=Bacillus smithii TaxID=1479 RepID=UPI003D1A6DCF